MNNNFKSIRPVIFVILISSSILLTADGTTLTSKDVAVSDESNNSLPTSFSWRNINGVDFTTPAKNQVGNSCEAYALCGAIETIVQHKVGYPFGCDLSESHLFLGSGGKRWGTYLEDAANFLVEYGVPDQSCCPFPDNHWNYSYNFTYDDWKDKAVKIKGWGYTDGTRLSIKENLTKHGPVVTYVHLYKDFYNYHAWDDLINNYPANVYSHRWGTSLGGHYIIIVGYDDNQSCWICKNSWGRKWGDDGFFNISYGKCGIETHSIYLENVSGNFPIKYVDDDNTEGPWDGTKEHPYQKIQDCIDNVFEGYTVYVFNGTYYENLIVNKTINLDGKNRDNTVIDGGGKEDVIFVSAEGVRISRFTIQNSGSRRFDSGIKIRLYGNAKASILNNTIQNNKAGIYLYTSFGCTIKNNIIQNNQDDGIHLFYSLNEDNNFKRSGRLLKKVKNYITSQFKKVKSFNNLIEKNTIWNNNGDGIDLEFSRGSWITNNGIYNNNESGILLRDGSNYNRIQSNSIKGNTKGVYISESFKNRIICNNFINNKVQAYFCNSFFNQWSKNYWDRPRFLPKLIQGHNGIQKHPYNVDWTPSKKLNDV